MTRSLRIPAALILSILLTVACKDKYVGPYIAPITGYLVVEGFISGNGPTQFKLSRTVPLSGNTGLQVEEGAAIHIEGDDNSSYSLQEQGNGIYTVDGLSLQTAVKYRVRIHTVGNKDFLSDYVPYKPTPAIDSISWKRDGNGVNIYANTHDASNATRYYQWQYDQTWQYTSAELSNGIYREPPPHVEYRVDSEQIYYCWRRAPSTTIMLGTSARLAQDVISDHLLLKIPVGSEEISVKYSISVSQYALTEEAHEYLSRMQRNTETLGSIFDAQPSELKGNIHSLSDPSEQVIGFVAAGTVEKKRIFIDRIEVGVWPWHVGCPMKDTLVPKTPSQNLKDFFQPGAGFTPVSEHFENGMSVGWDANFTSCVDCRANGGTNQKPSFWP